MLLTLADSTGARAGYWESLWLRRPAASNIGAEADSMFMWLWWFCVIWFVFLMALMGYFVVKYRRRPGVIAPRSASHNTVIELAWTIIPTLFLAYIFFRGLHGYMDKIVTPGDAVEMRLTGWKWSWKIEYPNGGESSSATTIGSRSVPVFYMPADQPVRLRMNSLDVMHAFWIPDLRIKQDIVPNRYTTMWFRFDAPEEGKNDVKIHPARLEDAISGRTDYIQQLAGELYTEHWVFCAEYCGTEHSEMAAIIRVVSKSAYERWLTTLGDDPDPIKLGQKVWRSKCMSCHTTDGGANTGPTWKNMFGYEFEHTDGSKHIVDENHVRDSIRAPAKLVRKGFGNNMTPFPENMVSERQLTGVIEYLKSISDKGGAPVESSPEHDAQHK